MNDTSRNDVLREVFRLAASSPNVADEPLPDDKNHPVNDDELLIRWSMGELEGSEHGQIVEHLAQCFYCRSELAAMIHAGALTLPEREDARDPGEASEPTVTALRDRSHPSWKQHALFAITAIAASLLVAVIWGLSARTTNNGSVVAMAQRDLAEGRSATAFERIGQFLDENQALDADMRAKANSLLEESGYRLASKELTSGTTESANRVLDIEGRIVRLSAESGRMVNLRIQAERGMSSERTLATKNSLTDYGYEDDGKNYGKDVGFLFPSVMDTTKRLAKEFAEASQRHPDSLDLRLNFGHFLMEQAEFPRAAEQFAAAVKINPKSALAETGLALALFQQETTDSIEQALAHFRKAVELAPNDPTTNHNRAVCLRRLGRDSEAGEFFKKSLIDRESQEVPQMKHE